MKDIFMDANDTFTAANGQVFPYADAFAAVRKKLKCGNFRATLSEEDMEDLYQEACIKCFRSAGSYDPGKSPLSAYFSRIAENCGRDACRRKNRQNAAFVRYGAWNAETGEEFLNPAVAGYRGDEFEADRNLWSEEAELMCRMALDSLNERYRTVLRLHAEGAKPAEVAEVVGCTKDAAYLLLCRARKAFAKKLGPGFLAEHGIMMA